MQYFKSSSATPLSVTVVVFTQFQNSEQLHSVHRTDITTNSASFWFESDVRDCKYIGKFQQLTDQLCKWFRELVTESFAYSNEAYSFRLGCFHT